MFEDIARLLKYIFGGETVAINVGFWSSAILLTVAAYTFFFKQTAAAYQKYYDYKFDKCAEAALTAAQIANVEQHKELSRALAKFDELYYGHLILFESKDLASKMVQFRQLFAKKDENLTVAKVLEIRRGSRAVVRQKALDLATSCRREVRPSLLHLIYDRNFHIPQ